jgi:hypothetical protein
MEIHAPHDSGLTFRDALVHLSIVTVGILIALSFEGTLQWWHHRALVRETKQRLATELRGNQESIQTVLNKAGPVRERFMHAIDLMADLSKPDKQTEAAALLGSGNILNDVSFAFFNTAAYTTAEVTGAFGYMEYADALKYADAYDLQAVYVRIQDNAEKELFTATMLGTSMKSKPTSVQIEDVSRQLRIAFGDLAMMQNVATKLSELYDRALKDAP